MRSIRLIIFLSFCLSSGQLFSQTIKTIEADLLQSFKMIDYWDQKKSEVQAYYKLTEANKIFSTKIESYTKKYPITLTAPFLKLKKEHLDILTSEDGLFRIYSWETWLGGTMRDFENVIQYKSGNTTASTLLKSTGDIYIPFYSNLYTFKANGKTYYLAVYGTIYSSKDAGSGIKCFAIENGKLNNDVKLIKTGSGFRNKIYHDYDFFSVVDWKKRPEITFDATTNTILVPLIDNNNQMTHKLIKYRFTGKYFEKVKS